jgi:hypothetical protein
MKAVKNLFFQFATAQRFVTPSDGAGRRTGAAREAPQARRPRRGGAYARHLGPRGVAAAIEAIARLDARVAATAAADAPLPTIDEAGSPSPAGAVPPKKRPIAYLNS